MSSNLNSSENKKSKKYDGSILTENIIGDILLQSVEPLVDIVRVHIADYVIKLRKQMFSKNEFNTVGRVSKIVDIPREVIYNWISRELINVWIIDDKKVVSISEVEHIKQTVYKPKIK